MKPGVDLDSVFDRAVSAFKAGDLDAAAEAGGLLMEHAPSHPATQNLMGLVRLRQGLCEHAVDLFRAAAKGAPDDPLVLRNLGNALRHTERTAESLASYEKAASLAPGDASALCDLAKAQLHADLPDQAAETFRRALRLEPDHMSSAVALAGLLARRGETDDELKVLDSVVSARPDDIDLLMTYTFSLRRAGRMREAVERHRDAVARRPDCAQAHAALAFRLGEAGELEEAVGAYQKGLELGPDDAGAWSNLGWTLVQLNRHREALDSCEKAVTLNPEDPDAHYHLALSRHGVGDLSGAAAALERALEIERRHVRALSLLGGIREELGQEAAARRIFDPDRMITRQEFAGVPGFATVAQFNAALAAAVRNHPSLTWNPADRATVSGSQTLEMAHDGSTAICAFHQCVDAAIRQYLAARAREAARGEFFHDPPTNWDITIWGVALRAGGHQIPHTHPSGIVSGVYYPALPATIGAGPEREDGFIEFRASSGPDEDPQIDAKRQRAALRPEEGHLLLFPSYFWHRTIPYEGTEDRISVAFDAVPRP